MTKTFKIYGTLEYNSKDNSWWIAPYLDNNTSTLVIGPADAYKLPDKLVDSMELNKLLIQTESKNNKMIKQDKFSKVKALLESILNETDDVNPTDRNLTHSLNPTPKTKMQAIILGTTFDIEPYNKPGESEIDAGEGGIMFRYKVYKSGKEFGELVTWVGGEAGLFINDTRLILKKGDYVIKR